MKLYEIVVRSPFQHGYENVQVLADSPGEAKEQIEIEYGEGAVVRYPRELS